MKKWAMVCCLLFSTGCAVVSTRFIRSGQEAALPKYRDEVLVFYSPEQVPFKFKELGRVFIKRSNYWGDRDQGAQIAEMRNHAAKEGADAIIVFQGSRYEASAGGYNGVYGAQAGDIHELSAVAILRTDRRPEERVEKRSPERVETQVTAKDGGGAF